MNPYLLIWRFGPVRSVRVLRRPSVRTVWGFVEVDSDLSGARGGLVSGTRDVPISSELSLSREESSGCSTSWAQPPAASRGSNCLATIAVSSSRSR